MGVGFTHEGSVFIAFRDCRFRDPRSHGLRWVDINHPRLPTESVGDKESLTALIGHEPFRDDHAGGGVLPGGLGHGPYWLRLVTPDAYETINREKDARIFREWVDSIGDVPVEPEVGLRREVVDRLAAVDRVYYLSGLGDEASTTGACARVLPRVRARRPLGRADHAPRRGRRLSRAPSGLRVRPVPGRVGWMDAHEVNRVRAKLALYAADVFASVPRKDQRAKGDCCLRGLMLDGRHTSIQAMAARLPDGNEQNPRQFVNQSTWDPVPVQRRICERMLPLISPTARVIDDVSVPEDGRMSVAVAPQYCGALGKRATCRVAVGVHAAGDTASCPLQWRLFPPHEWAADPGGRTATRPRSRTARGGGRLRTCSTRRPAGA